MNTKNILSILSILTILVLTLGLTSALSIVDLSHSDTIYINQTTYSFSFKLNNTNDTYSVSNIALSGTVPYGNVTFSPATISSLSTSTSQLINATVTLTKVIDTSIAINIAATGTLNGTTDSASTSFSLTTKNGYCPVGNIGSLQLYDLSINNIGEGDSDEWKPLDQIDIEVEVKNPTSSSMSSIKAEIKVLDENNTDVTDDFNFDDTSIKMGTIKDDDSKIVTFKISSLSSKIEEGDYRIFIKAYKDGSDSEICVDTSNALNERIFHKIIVTKDDSGVVLNQNKLTTLEASCGDQTTYSFNVYNVGADKQKSVLVKIFSKDLKIDQIQQISSLRADNDQSVSFDFTIPSILNKTSQTINVVTYFDYDEGDVLDYRNYDSNSDNDLGKVYSIPVKLSNCQTVVSSTSITAALLEGTKTVVGENLTVKALITNTGSASAAYSLSLSGYDSWANLGAIDPQTVTINAGETKTVTLTLIPTKSGTQSFVIKATANGKTTEQSVQVTMTGNQNLISQIQNQVGTVGLYLIIGIVALVVIILIVLIIKLIFSGRARKSSDF